MTAYGYRDQIEQAETSGDFAESSQLLEEAKVALSLPELEDLYVLVRQTHA